MTGPRPHLRLLTAAATPEPPALEPATSGPSLLGPDPSGSSAVASPWTLTRAADRAGLSLCAADPMMTGLDPPDAAAPPPLAVEPTDAAAALSALDARLAAGDPPDAACAELAALALRVPGRQRQVAAALGRAASSAAVDALLTLPPAAPGVLEALHRCFSRGVRRRLSPETCLQGHVPLTSLDDAPPLLALEFRGSRARGFPDLVRRAQALATGAGAELRALAVAGKPHYRLAFWPDRVAPRVFAADLGAAHLDLVWLHARLARLQGTRLWLSGWRFDANGPLGPSGQALLLQGWLRWAETELSSS